MKGEGALLMCRLALEVAIASLGSSTSFRHPLYRYSPHYLTAVPPSDRKKLRWKPFLPVDQEGRWDAKGSGLVVIAFGPH